MQYTIVPTDTPATYLRLQLHRPTLLQRVYRELAATLLVAGCVETKAGVHGRPARPEAADWPDRGWDSLRALALKAAAGGSLSRLAFDTGGSRLLHRTGLKDQGMPAAP